MNVELPKSDSLTATSHQEPPAMRASWFGPHPWISAFLMGSLLALLLGLSGAYLSVPQYTASGLIIIADNAPYIAFASNTPSSGDDGFSQLQIELLKSVVMLESLASVPEVASIPEVAHATDRIKHIQERITIARLGTSDVYSVAYTGRSPEAAAVLVNALLSEYLRYHQSDDAQHLQRTIDILEDERRRRALEVERLRRRLVALSEEVAGEDPFGRGIVSGAGRDTELLTSLHQSLIDVDAEREAISAELHYLKTHPAPLAEPVNILADTDSEKQIPTETRLWRAAVVEDEALLEQIIATETKWNENPNYVQLDRAVKSHRAQLDKYEKEFRSRVSSQESDRSKIDPHSSVYLMERTLAGLEAKRHFLSQQASDLTSIRQVRNAKVIELEYARAELARDEKVFELVANRKLEIQTELRAPSRVVLAKNAVAPVAPDEWPPYRRLAIACFAAMLVPFAAVVALRMFA